ncbi:MAG: methyltransferase [Clostridiales bacterium]|nr:methyltransferase [Clostridiales bacterium]
MNTRERFFATIARKQVDRPAFWLGMPTDEALPILYDYFGVTNYTDLKLKIDDDIWTVEMPYHSPYSDAIYSAFDFAKKDAVIQERTLTAPGFFEHYEEPEAVDLFDWPDPERYISTEECKRVVNQAPEGYPVMAVIWSAHFQDACAAFGMEDALVKMKTCPELFDAVIDRITDFYLKANRIFFEAVKGRLDAVLIGNDFGTQTGLILSPEDLRRFVFKGTRKIIEQAKEYGLTVIHHSCGAISEVIDDLIDCGADVIHPIQAMAKGMEPQSLKLGFGDRVSFCGGVDAQHLLVNGSAEEIAQKVRELCRIFPTGLIVSPSHEAILPDVPPENIEAIRRAVNNR